MSYLSCFVLLPVSFTTWVKCLLMKVPRLFNWQETALWGTLLHEWEDELSTTDLFLKIGREKRWNRLGLVWVLRWTAVLLLSSTCNAVLECIIQSCPSSEVKGRGLAIDDSQGEFSVKRGAGERGWERVHVNQRESEQWCLSCAPAICLRQSLLISVIFFSAHLHFESFLFSPSFIFQFMFFFFNLSFADFGSVAPDPPPKKMKSLALTPEHRLADFASLVPLLSRFLVPPLIL